MIAAAGLDRLGVGARIDQRIDPTLVTPAPAQGALAVQARESDASLLELLVVHDQPHIRLAVEAERRVLFATGGTCRAPVGWLASSTGIASRSSPAASTATDRTSASNPLTATVGRRWRSLKLPAGGWRAR